ncbi:hypothetical protein ACE193_15300 [Bernardetia sp. OM2101]|uniref:hypothetical protein n=1 Tax=Bernardetia sp. OM2101 TaxID=3344876 RepID=UPI0035D129ED
MKPYSKKGKQFVKRLHSLESYEDTEYKNNNPNNPSDGYWNYQEKKGLVKYTPKKTQHKKDVIAAFRRSGKKTERQNAKKEIKKAFRTKKNYEQSKPT